MKLAPIAEAVDALHAAGELHLDLTPSNILLHEGRPWISDPAPPGAGTAGWVDPHVVAGAPASAASDVFSLAVTATFCLARNIPRPERPVDAPVSAAACAVLEDALSSDPRRRPSSPAALVESLAAALSRGSPEVAVERHDRTPPVSSTRLRLPRTWPFPHPRDAAAQMAAQHESIRDATGSTHDTARVTGWRRTRRGG
jgi:serine/threonine protein kinase